MAIQRVARCILLLCVAAVFVCLQPASLSAGDWPMYRHDARRSAVSTESLDLPLNLVWHWKSRRPPNPAFADPLRHPTEIDFAHVRDFPQPVQLTFDHAFHPVAANGRAFFGSSVDDSVRCVSLKTAERATKNGRIGGIGRKAGYVVNVARERKNPLSLDMSAFEYNRGKGCGYPVFSDTLHVLRSGTLAFYDLNDDSGMRYFGGVRPGCTIGAVPA